MKSPLYIPDRQERVALCLFMDQYNADPDFSEKQKRELQNNAFHDLPYLCQRERDKWMIKADEKPATEGEK